MNNRLINTKVAGGGGGCTDIVDNYDPFGGNGVALYQLNGDATDESGNYDGTPSNITYGTGVFGQAAYFNGSNSKIGGLPLANNNVTVSYWFNSQGLTGNRMMFSTNSTNGKGWQVNADGATLNYVDREGILSNKTGVFAGQYSIQNNIWYHICIIIKTNNVYFYLNGQEIGSASKSVSYTSTNTFFGLQQDANTYYWKGYIDQARFFDTALTPLEVEALYTEELCICDGTVDTLQVLGDTSCIATYQLDGNANDLSGNYSGTPTDVSYGVGEFDLAGVFNGSSSYIAVPSGLRRDNDFTVSMWFKTNSTTDGQVLVSFRNGKKLQIGLNNSNVGNASIRVNSGNNTAVDSATGVFTTNTWYHFTLVQSSITGVAVYLNNSIVASNSGATGDLVTVSGIDAIGSYENSSDFFNGSIDQFRYFNKALSAGEVTTLYNETACSKYSGFTAYVASMTSDSIASIDVTNLNNLSALDSYTSSNLNGAYDVALDSDNNIAYVSSVNANSITAIDISDPSNLSEISTFTNANLNYPKSIKLDLANQVAYTVNSNNFNIVSVDISNPSNMTFLDAFTESSMTGASQLSLDTTNQIAYVSCDYYAGNLVSIDVSNPSNMSRIGFVSAININCMALDIINQRIYLAQDAVLFCYDISNPSSMSLIGSVSGGNMSRINGIALDVSNGVAYLASYLNSRIISYNISNPSSMSELGFYTNSSTLYGANGITLDLQSNIAYVASALSDSITAINIGNPSSMTEFDSYTSADLNFAANVALN